MKGSDSGLKASRQDELRAGRGWVGTAEDTGTENAISRQTRQEKTLSLTFSECPENSQETMI